MSPQGDSSIWPYVRGPSQNIAVQKYSIRLPSGSVCKVDMKEVMNFLFRCGPILKIAHSIYASIPKSEKVQNPEHFWSKAFQIRDTQPVLPVMIFLLICLTAEVLLFFERRLGQCWQWGCRVYNVRFLLANLDEAPGRYHEGFRENSGIPALQEWIFYL